MHWALLACTELSALSGYEYACTVDVKALQALAYSPSFTIRDDMLCCN